MLKIMEQLINKKFKYTVVGALAAAIVVLFCSLFLLSSCKSDNGTAPNRWPDLPVKSDLYYFSVSNIQRLNLANGTITSIGGEGDKPDQNRAVDVSRDGSEIVFVYYGSSSEGTVREIRILNNGGERIATIPVNGQYNRIKVSPDKSKFACKRMTEDVIDIVERNGNVLGNYSGVNSAAWTPDGKLVLTSGEGEIFVSSADLTSGSVIAKLGSAVLEPDVSPDGQKIAFYRAGNVWAINIDGSALSQLTESSLECFMPCWSKDSKYLAVLWGMSQEQNHLSAPDVYLIPAKEGKIEVSENSSKAVLLYEKFPDSNGSDYVGLGSNSQPMLR